VCVLYAILCLEGRRARISAEAKFREVVTPENNPSNRSIPQYPSYRNLLPIRTGLCKWTGHSSDCAKVHQIKKNPGLLRKVLNTAVHEAPRSECYVTKGSTQVRSRIISWYLHIILKNSRRACAHRARTIRIASMVARDMRCTGCSPSCDARYL
jgi:hypothetical protein